MTAPLRNYLKIALCGFFTGVALVVCVFFLLRWKDTHPNWVQQIKSIFNQDISFQLFNSQYTEEFDKPMKAVSGLSFGKNNQLTFELFRNGTFEIDGQSGYAYQKSLSYRDSAFIRNTIKLPNTYKITMVVGEIDYNLEKVSKLPKDPEYPEGPTNENGCYLIAITDEKPVGHHTNIWWHQHRKLVIDVDNNVWGHGMPNPLFMVYFDRSNRLKAFDGERQEWLSDWRKAVTYDPAAWYTIEVEKTKTHFILSVSTEQGRLLQKAKVKRADVWSEDGFHEDYFVIGDPHENYYQGTMKIKSIAWTPTE